MRRVPLREKEGRRKECGKGMEFPGIEGLRLWGIHVLIWEALKPP